MKKLLCLAVSAMLFIGTTNAQSFAKKDNVIGVNVGIGSDFGVPISVTYERGVYDINNKMAIGVGGIAGFGIDSYKYLGVKDRYTNVMFGARGAWHYTGVKKLDLYAGLTLGYNVVALGDLTDNDNEFLWGVYGGARYFFTPLFGVNAEVGYGLAYLNLGISFKF